MCRTIVNMKGLLLRAILCLVVGLGIGVAIAVWRSPYTEMTVAHRVQAVAENQTASATPIPSPTPTQPVPANNFIEITDSCGPHFEGACLSVRSGPGTEFPAVGKLRTGVVLAVATTTVIGEDGSEWYHVVFNEWLRYPERVSGEWYVSAAYVRAFADDGTEESDTPRPSLLEEARKQLGLASGKRIIVDRSEQKLYAYDGDTLYLTAPVSTGLDLTPTPRGTFTVYKKTPSRYMQGPLPGVSDQYYDLPGVPWNMYFTDEGGAIHGAFWHAEFGAQWSHGCVNLPLDTARTLYEWTPIGTPVLVRD